MSATSVCTPLLAAIILTACSQEPSVPRPRASFLPVARFVDDLRDAPSYVSIGGQARPVLSAAGEFPLPGAWAEGPDPAHPVYRVEAAVGSSWIFLQPLAQFPRSQFRMPPLGVRAGTGVATDIVPTFGGVGPKGPGTIAITACAAPDLDARDVLTRPVDVPPGAVLAFAIGVEEVAWTANAVPVDFTVTALGDGQEEPVYRRRMDPARRLEDRRWVEVRAPLEGVTGPGVKFRFAARAAVPEDGGTSLPVWADPVVLAPGRAMPIAGVVLVSLDTLRARSVGSYGCARPTTPGLEYLMAEEGVLFENAIAPAPHTLPSHMSMFTGLYVRTHGVIDYMQSLAAQHRTLPEVLRAAGYETAAFTEGGFILPAAGFRRGFGLFAEQRSADFMQVGGHVADTFRNGARWLRQHSDRPFFLFLHTYQVHEPYMPPPGYRGYFEETAAAGSDSDLALLRYEQEIRYTDDELRALLEEIEALGLGLRTLVVVTADHGEEFLEHGQLHHGSQLYDEAIRVPLVMRLPGMIPSGLRVSTPVSLVDIEPTILDVLGLPTPWGSEGESLLPLLLGDARQFPRAGVFAQARSAPGLPSLDLAGVRTATHSCIRRTPTAIEECYDLRSDPGEELPLALDRADASRAEAHALLDAFLAGGDAPAPPRAEGRMPLEKERELRALGYVH